MKQIAFLGSHPLGEACLQILHDHPSVSVPAVVTYPEDRQHWWDGSVRKLAIKLGLEVLELDEVNTLSKYDLDWLISVYYPNILKEGLLAHPNEGAVNLHQAELPRYRGSNVFSHSIMNARSDNHWRHGTSLHFMSPTVDAGDLIDRKFVEITEEDTARSLYERTCQQSLSLFQSQLPNILNESVYQARTPQQAFEGQQYFYTKDSLDELKEIPTELLLDTERATEMYDRVRALNFPPHEPAWTRIDGKKIHLTIGPDQ
jgi:methionyl-tRNA formyltransferase